MVVNMLGTEAAFEILNVMEYSSARGRMSVIARAPSGSVRLLSKGSDAKVIGILHRASPRRCWTPPTPTCTSSPPRCESRQAGHP